MLHIVLWKWKQENFRERYNAQHVNVMAKQLAEALEGVDYRVLCVTDDPTGVEAPVECYPLWKDHDGVANITGRHLPSCYRRLKLFDAATQADLGMAHGDRIISLDLDSIVLGPLHEVLAHIEAKAPAFVGWGVRGVYHETVFNGSFWSFNAGSHLQHVWADFDAIKSPRETLAQGFLGSDQGWLSRQFAKSKDSLAIRYPMFASYPREIRRTGRLQRTTKIVFFHGARKPWHPEELRHQPWIHRYWRLQHA